MSLLNAIASLLTIATTAINVVYAFGGIQSPFSALPSLPAPKGLISFLLFCYLEIAISAFFAYCIIKIKDFWEYESPFAYLLTFPILIALFLASAWTSLFNVEWLFIEPHWEYSTFLSLETAKLSFWIFISNIIIIVLSGSFSARTDRFLSDYYEYRSYFDEAPKFSENDAFLMAVVHGAVTLSVILYKFVI